ncbi:hypothetical protein [Streptomyces sp. NPDC018693]|uniref:hypothetical protein n=1 Tax=unclassified Streptomyces TaxID=2593676 RepID=UPI0037A23DF2
MTRRTSGTRAVKIATAFGATVAAALLTTVGAVQTATGVTTAQGFDPEPANPDLPTCWVNGWQEIIHDCSK